MPIEIFKKDAGSHDPAVFQDDMDEPPVRKRVVTVRDRRAPEEITEDDLNMVAVYVSEKKYDSIYVGVFVVSPCKRHLTLTYRGNHTVGWCLGWSWSQTFGGNGLPQCSERLL